MRQFKPVPPSTALGQTLARRVQQLREFRNMTVRDLSGYSRFPVARIEDIESGLETWLSATDRQLLSKALSVEPSCLQDVESRPGLPHERLRGINGVQMAQSILAGARDLECPFCGGTLKCSIQNAFDMEGRPVQFAKAFCIKCTFVLK